MSLANDEVCYLCHAQRSSSAPLSLCQSKWGRNARWRRENVTKVSGSAFLGKMTILEAFVLPNFPVPPFVFWNETQKGDYKRSLKNAPPSFRLDCGYFIPRNIATAGDSAKLSRYLCIVSYSSNDLLNLNLFKAHFSFAAATEIDLESDNAPRANSCQVW